MNGAYLAHCNGDNIRNKNDLYETPYSITAQLLDRIKLVGTILEPACGNNAIVKVLNKYGYQNITAYDIETDFLKETRHFDTIITNPPYSIANLFIKKAQELAYDVFMFLPLNYLHGSERYHEFYENNKFKLQTVYVFVRYPNLKKALREDGKYETGMVVSAWFHWNKYYEGEPVIRWIDNNPFIVGKHDPN